MLIFTFRGAKERTREETERREQQERVCGKDRMGLLYEDVVLISKAEKPGEPTVITVNCPDKTGLGCDLCRVILLFGLSISRGGKLYLPDIECLFFLSFLS